MQKQYEDRLVSRLTEGMPGRTFIMYRYFSSRGERFETMVALHDYKATSEVISEENRLSLEKEMEKTIKAYLNKGNNKVGFSKET